MDPARRDLPHRSHTNVWANRVVSAIALTSAFFYPLAAAIDDQIFYLHWQPRHTAELAVAYVALTLIGVLLFTVLDRVRADRPAVFGLAAILIVPLTSLAVGLFRAIPFKDVVAPLTALWWVRGLVVAGAVIVAGVVVAFPRRVRWVLRRLPLVLSPVSLVVLLRLATLVPYPASAARFNHRGPESGIRSGAPRVLVLLFDELSFRSLYDERDIRTAYPHLRAFGAHATHYRAATAPGEETSISLPGYLLDRPVAATDVVGDAFLEKRADGTRAAIDVNASGNLFADLKGHGWRTEMMGWYLPYCRLFEAALDRCEAFSLYNASTVSDSFSPLAPLRTTLILWPHQFPAGLLKNPAFAAHQHALTEHLESAAGSPWADGRPTLRFVHFSVPHVPFVFDRDGYNPPFEPVSTRLDLYERQLAYVDTLFGRLIDGLADSTRPTTVVVLSDHEFRSVTPRSEWPHVPLLVRGSNQTERQERPQPVRASEILRATLAAAIADNRQ